MIAFRAYYNEIEPYAASWLRNLIRAGVLPPGDVDERDIRDVHPFDLRGYRQCHFFAGIGVWPFALGLAGWPSDRCVWTGSCPCQPFSAAGRGAGFADERHLWPHWHHLIRECRPSVVFGEQVASKDADPWIDLVQDDMEALGYALGAEPVPAAGIGAPHIRDRLWWVADDAEPRRDEQSLRHGRTDRRAAAEPRRLCTTGRMGDHHYQGLPSRQCETLVGAGRRVEGRTALQPGGPSGGVGYAHGERQDSLSVICGTARTEPPGRICLGGMANNNDRCAAAPVTGLRDEEHHVESCGGYDWSGPLHGFWRDADWLLCRDGKWRPVEPGTFPLAHGAPARVGRLRAYGNAIVAPLAAEFIRAVMDVRGIVASGRRVPARAC